MAHAIWKGTISFGLVNIPVSLFSGEKREVLDFTLLDRRDFASVGYQRINKTTNETVPWEEIVKGYEVDGEMVVLTDDDFDRVAVEATQTVELSSFVDRGEIDPIYFDRPYYLVPQRAGKQKLNKAYVLLRETLERSGKVGVAKVVIRTREHLAVVMPREHLLVLNLLRFPDEVREPKEFFADDADAKVAMIERKAKSGKTEPVIEAPKERKPSKVIDLIPLLERSVAARQRTTGQRPARRHAQRSRGRKPGARKRIRKSA